MAGKPFVDRNAPELSLYDRATTPKEFQVISREEEYRLAKLMVAGDEDARNKLVNANMRFIILLARRWAPRSSMDLSDMVAEGVLRMMEVLEKYNPEMGTRVTTWVGRMVEFHMARVCETQRLVRRPVQKFRMTPDQLDDPEYLHSRAMMSPIASLDEPVDGGDGETHALGALMPADQELDDFEAWLDREWQDVMLVKLETAIESIPDERVKLIARARMNGETLLKIGRDIGVTRERVRQLEKKAIAHIGKAMGGKHGWSFSECNGSRALGQLKNRAS